MDSVTVWAFICEMPKTVRIRNTIYLMIIQVVVP